MAQPHKGEGNKEAHPKKKTRFDPGTGKRRIQSDAHTPRSKPLRVIFLVAAATVAALTGVALAGSSNLSSRSKD